MARNVRNQADASLCDKRKLAAESRIQDGSLCKLKQLMHMCRSEGFHSSSSIWTLQGDKTCESYQREPCGPPGAKRAHLQDFADGVLDFVVACGGSDCVSTHLTRQTLVKFHTSPSSFNISSPLRSVIEQFTALQNQGSAGLCQCRVLCLIAPFPTLPSGI